LNELRFTGKFLPETVGKMPQFFSYRSILSSSMVCTGLLLGYDGGGSSVRILKPSVLPDFTVLTIFPRFFYSVATHLVGLFTVTALFYKAILSFRMRKVLQ